MIDRQRTFTLLCPFGGLGAGARGFLDASVDLCGERGEFHLLGSIDFDDVACADAEQLTGRPAWCVDVRTITPAQLVQRYGRRAPDVVFASPPCQGASRLLSEAKSREQKYEDLNQLTLVWLDVMLEAWRAAPPRLVLIENVPGLPKRAASMLKAARKKLRAAGYVFTDGTHDCGEIGGLAQHRKRYLLVARHTKSCPPLLYQPPVKRVRGVGEVLEQLPMPATLAAAEWGAMHTMPKLSWRNWLRLALIPAGGDWRDLAGVLEGRARREVFRRHAVQAWDQPHPAVTGPGGHSVEAVADARVQLGCAPHAGAYGMVGWEDPAPTITASGNVDNRPVSVADPRVAGGREWHAGALGVRDWEAPSGAVTGGASSPTCGTFSVADPRLAVPPRAWGGGDLGVTPWDEPSATIAGESMPRNGRFSVSDPRVGIPAGTDLHTNKHAVLDWADPSPTVIGQPQPSSGAPAVADPRLGFGDRQADRSRSEQRPGWYGVLGWDEPARTVAGTANVGTGAYSVADARTGWAEGVRVLTLDEAMALELDPAKPPPWIPVIVAEDGTWHRPMTLLELAALQGLPLRVNGKPLQLSGTRTQQATHIGNAVPVGAAHAIATRMLIALLEADGAGWSLAGGDTPVWIAPAEWGGLHA